MNFQIKRTLLALSIISSTALPLAHAESDGGANGGGGVVISKDGKLMLPAEAGFMIELPAEIKPRLYKPEPEVVAALDNILRSLGLGTSSRTSVKQTTLGNSDTLFLVSDIDPELKEKIMNDYREVTKAANVPIPISKLMFAAWSDKDKTYLLPQFLKLSAMQKAKILIHETSYRGQNNIKEATERQKLVKVLTLDSALERFLQTSTSTINQQLKVLIIMADSQHFNWLNTTLMLAIQKLQQTYANPLRANQIFTIDESKFNNGEGLVSFKDQAYQEFTGQDVFLQSYFEGKNVSLSNSTTHMELAISEGYKESDVWANQAAIMKVVQERILARLCVPAIANVDDKFVALDPLNKNPFAFNCVKAQLIRLSLY